MVVSAVQLKRWSRDEYDRMIDAVVFASDERVELLEGESSRWQLRTPDTRRESWQLAISCPDDESPQQL